MIVIVDYGMGNLHSVLKACRRIGAEATISSKKEDIETAEKIILPGVGHFKKGMDNLNQLGLIDVLNKKVLVEGTPVLGICLGMQLLTKRSEEGESPGLGWIDAEAIKLKSNGFLKVPHMGWNDLESKKESDLLPTEARESSFYFVHSFCVRCNDEKDILTTTNYGEDFVSAIQKDNIYGVQFHPEKSHGSGLQLLKNFVNMKNV
jgi:imidazole glycerol-phosphate synthase subunit HisH